MNIGLILKRVKKVATDNAPALLTAVGVAGTITTAVLASQATFKASMVLYEDWHDTTTKDKVAKTWKLYVPAAGTCALTVAAIVGANHISSSRATALASAYAISQDAFITYKDKVLEKFGEKKEQDIVDAIAADKVKENPPPATLFVPGSSKVPVLDTHSGRYFMSTLEDLKKAENDTNYTIIHSDYASLTDYWDNVGLPKTSESDEVGWSSDTKLVVEYGTALTDDGMPCITISFRTFPVRGYGSIY